MNDNGLLIAGALLGIVSSVIASLIFTVGVRLLRPEIEISDQIADEHGRHRVKIVNARRRDAVDVNVHIFIEQPRQVQGETSHQILSRVGNRFNMDALPGQSRPNKKDPRARYARWIRLDEEFRTIWEEKGHDYPVLIVVFAKDAVSGVGRLFEKRYGPPHISVAKGVFKTGISMRVLPIEALEPVSPTS
jgi:hypothetical protein